MSTSTTTMTIAVINESTSIGDAEIKGYLGAFEKQWNEHLVPAWSVEKAKFKFVHKEEQAPRGAWWLVWLDDADQAGALAYHDVTDEGQPLSKVFVKTIKADNASLTVAATHELVEMAVDPTINLAAQDQRGIFWAYESADPVEADRFGYMIDNVLVTDFLLPSWFDYKNSSGPYDYMKYCTDPFQVLPGGYAQYFDPHKGWHQINASNMKQARAINPSEGSRRERRARQLKGIERSGTRETRDRVRAAFTTSKG